MAQQFDYPKTETQLREIQDALYQHSKEVYEAGGRPAFKGLLEIMSAESTIITAIHNIKGNHGSETPGVDSKTMRKDYLQKPFPWVVADIQRAFKHFEPQQIRRVYIDKVHLSILNPSRYGEYISTNRENQKSGLWAFLQYGIESYKNV